ncbi:amidohydrolase family protein [Microbacterium sp. RD1]|uniref:amidohydrolase family protein n=1 Tax=Microbacterium sp. RD1 TaxID=3457313 RepID=UPI003FA57145
MMGTVLIRGGVVVPMTSPDDVPAVADILVVDGRIAQIAPDLPVGGDQRVIDATGTAVLPGLVDGHRHLWYTPLRATAMDHGILDLSEILWEQVGPRITATDMYAATRAGILDALDHGITTVVDYCHAVNTPDHAIAAVRAHAELPGRALFGYGPAITEKFADPARPSDWSHAADLIASARGTMPDRISFALAIQNPAASTRSRFETDVHTAREWGIPVITHIASRGGGKPEREVQQIHEWGLLGADLHFSHCCASTTTELELMREAGTSVTVSPMAESWLGIAVPPIRRMQNAGLAPSVGADAVCSSSGDLFEEARAGLLASRLVSIQEVNATGRPAGVAADIPMSTYDALASITSRGAAAAGLSEEVGQLRVGMRADVILVQLPDDDLLPDEVIPWIVSTAHGSNVNAVLVDGKIVKERKRLVGIDREEITAGLRLARNSMLRDDRP